VSIRNGRRDANSQLKALLKDKAISTDEERSAQDKIQKLTDSFIAQVDEHLAHKEKDLQMVSCKSFQKRLENFYLLLFREI